MDALADYIPNEILRINYMNKIIRINSVSEIIRNYMSEIHIICVKIL
jgi:hypothetical protein